MAFAPRWLMPTPCPKPIVFTVTESSSIYILKFVLASPSAFLKSRPLTTVSPRRSLSTLPLSYLDSISTASSRRFERIWDFGNAFSIFFANSERPRLTTST